MPEHNSPDEGGIDDSIMPGDAVDWEEAAKYAEDMATEFYQVGSYDDYVATGFIVTVQGFYDDPEVAISALTRLGIQESERRMGLNRSPMPCHEHIRDTVVIYDQSTSETDYESSKTVRWYHSPMITFVLLRFGLRRST